MSIDTEAERTPRPKKIDTATLALAPILSAMQMGGALVSDPFGGLTRRSPME